MKNANKGKKNKNLFKVLTIIAGVLFGLCVCLYVFVNTNNSLAKKHKTFPNIFGVSYYPVLDSKFEGYNFGDLILIGNMREDENADVVGLTPWRTIEIFSEGDVTSDFIAAGRIKGKIPLLGLWHEEITRLPGVTFLLILPLLIFVILLEYTYKLKKGLVGKKSADSDEIEQTEEQQEVDDVLEDVLEEAEQVIKVETVQSTVVNTNKSYDDSPNTDELPLQTEDEAICAEMLSKTQIDEILDEIKEYDFKEKNKAGNNYGKEVLTTSKNEGSQKPIRPRLTADEILAMRKKEIEGKTDPQKNDTTKDEVDKMVEIYYNPDIT